jgi:DNA repair exonuclease SbcCD ATPase subunit
MILNKIRWQNLLSYGNYWTEVDFTADDLTVIVGSNGVGKSTLLDALCYGLFGKPFRNINLPLLVNSITKKNFVVEIDFQVGYYEYRIVRGMKPAVFEIWRRVSNGAEAYAKQDMEGVRDEQAVLEQILGCNKKSFEQVVCLGANYTPFLSLDKAARRKIVENLLDLEIFSDMNVLLKEDYGKLTDTLKELETERTIYREKLAAWQSALEKSSIYKQLRIESFERDIESLKSEKFSMKETLNLLNIWPVEEYNELIKKIASSSDRYDHWCKNDIECDQHLKRVGAEVKFFEDHKTCPTCQQNIDPEFVKKMWEDKNYHLGRYREAKIKIKGELEAAHELYTVNSQMKENQDNAIRERHSLKYKIDQIDNYIASDKDKIEAEKAEHEIVKQETIDQLNNELFLLDQQLTTYFDDKATLQSISKMLKDDGIKAGVISKYINVINTLINKFLTEMDLFVNLYLDGEFNETIKSRYRDEFRYDSFSEGQKMRIDLAILFAWREIAKQRNSLSVNLLIFDEVLSGSLDSEGIIDLVKILEGRFQENIFLITHDDRITSRFANVINVSQEGGFSRMSRRGLDDK